jgi:selT/selW/selH selenoprotein domain
MLPQAQSQLKKGLLILFLISLAMDFYPRWKSPENIEILTSGDETTRSPRVNKTPADSTSPESDSNYQGQQEPGYERKTRPEGGNFEIHDLHIAYCVSCSYKGLYQKVADHVQKNYPMINISGSEYPASPEKVFLGKALTFVQYGLFAILLFGDQIFAALKITPPAIYYKLREKKMMAGMMIFFLGNNLHSMLTSTGAFEITLDGQLVFSKLASGRMPSIADIDAILADF